MFMKMGSMDADHPLARMLLESLGGHENPIKGMKYLPLEVVTSLKDKIGTYYAVVATTCGMEMKDVSRFKESIGEMPDEDKALEVEAWLDYMLNATEKCRNLLINRLKEIRGKKS